jgi:asparagine synthase (glutamine-hydrolysing)
MCGLAGFCNLNRDVATDALRSTARRMADTLRHRGPDDGDSWAEETAGIALGFRRLSIIDLSPHGRQPMHSDSGRFVLVFNGEVYNFQLLRNQLEKEPNQRPFRGHSDTEVMLRAIENWGLTETLKRSIGMYAFALWDRKERILHLGRDRMGEKPLYYGWMGNSFLFASELKAFRVYPDFHAEINREALASFLRYGYIPAPTSIYQGICKLPPGTTLTLDCRHGKTLPEPVPYWTVRKAAEAGLNHPLDLPESEAVDALDQLLRHAVSQQMVADVPLGAFLSGGIDSSTIVSLMQAQSSRPVRTFSIGFGEQFFNEAVHARGVAQHLKTEHTELYVTPADALAVIPQLAGLYDEPFADASQIPTYLVSRLARRAVTVSLSGDGGDELFAGYRAYRLAHAIWKRLRWLPPVMRRAAAGMLASVTPHGWEQVFAGLPLRLRGQASGDRVHKLAELIHDVQDVETTYDSLVSRWKHVHTLVPGMPLDSSGGEVRTHWEYPASPIDRLMYQDQMRYLPDNILAKVDRASMGSSLESRAPLLDHRIVEFAWRVPMRMKLRQGQGKWLLRQVLYRYVPAELIERPKMGFCVPIGDWLRGPLRDWAEDLLDEMKMTQQGFLNSQPVLRKWREHVSGNRNWQDHLWHVLMFQDWLAAQ